MCIIITKEKNAAPLPEEIFNIIWTNNPDGAGILYHDGKKAVLKKGLMKRDEFLKEAKEVNKKGISYIMHTRIATHGSVKPENTHPFVSKYLGFAHNGTFNVEPFPDKTDSETFFIGAIGNKKYKWCEDNKFLLDMATNGCRCAIMDLESGKIMHLCEEDWKLDKKYKGYKFSNTSYMQITRYSYSPTTGTNYYGGSGCYGGYSSDKSYGFEDYDDWNPEDKYGKISKQYRKIVDDIKIEQFQRTKDSMLKVDKEWEKSFLESYSTKEHDKKDEQIINNTLSLLSKEYAESLRLDGKDSYESLASGIILNFMAYASAQGYKNVKYNLTALKEMLASCTDATEEDGMLIAELESQIKEWM